MAFFPPGDLYTPDPWYFLQNPFQMFYDDPYTIMPMFPAYDNYTSYDEFELFRMPNGEMVPYMDFFNMGNVFYWDADSIKQMDLHRKEIIMNQLIELATKNKPGRGGKRRKKNQKCTSACVCHMNMNQVKAILGNLFTIQSNYFDNLSKDQLCYMFDMLHRSDILQSFNYKSWGLHKPWYEWVIEKAIERAYSTTSPSSSSSSPSSPAAPDSWDFKQFSNNYKMQGINELCTKVTGQTCTMKDEKEAEAWFTNLKNTNKPMYDKLYNIIIKRASV
jgi:hypothetical protein